MATKLNGSSNGGLRNSAGSKPVKKLVIRGLKTSKGLPDDYEQKTWEKLQAAIAAVQNKQAVQYGEEELYKATENLCSQKLGAGLYSKIQGECERHIRAQKAALQQLVRTQEPSSFLISVNNVWNDYCQAMFYIRSIFLYLDRTYVIQTAGVSSLWDLGLQLWRDNVIADSEVEKKLIVGLLSLVERERDGEMVERDLIKNLIRMLASIGVYAERFERSFVVATGKYYSQESARLLADMEMADYLAHAEERLVQEEQRVTHYLEPSTRRPLLTAVENALIAAHADGILQKGFDRLVDQGRVADLARLYTLFSRVQSLPLVRVAFNTHIRAAGAEIVNDAERDKTMVPTLLELKTKLDTILRDSFHSTDIFAHAMKEAFEHFINTRENRPAELIAKFVDAKLKAGNKAATEEELEALMDRVMVLFRFINGKDVFEAFYKKDLAKRLLLGKSASIDAEKSMISKLKTECGSGFTSKLEGMFKDVELSKDIMISFRQSRQAQELKDLEVNVSVLTTGYWPAYTPLDIKLPPQLAHCQDVFRAFYLGKYQGRRLFWQHTLGHTVLKAFFPKGRKELAVSLVQTVVMLLFNDTKSISYKDIAEATGIEQKELKRTLLSLACGKVRPLTKEPKGKEVGDDDVFNFNDDFRHKLYRIKVNSIQMKETEEENTKTKESVFQDRQFQIDAAIVRIMKTRKTLTHNQLMAELYQQLKFPLKPADVKKRIESLIDREYLERDP